LPIRQIRRDIVVPRLVIHVNCCPLQLDHRLPGFHPNRNVVVISVSFGLFVGYRYFANDDTLQYCQVYAIVATTMVSLWRRRIQLWLLPPTQESKMI
jgi:hypothetical protein